MFSEKDCRENGGGFTGTGCVAQARSPFRSDAGTRRSSSGKSGSPVSRSKTNTCPDFVACATASTSRPPRFTVRRTGGLRQVAVPQVVADHLEVPHALAGRGPQRQDAVAEEVLAVAVAAPEVPRGEPVGRKTSPARVDADPAPRVGAAHRLPGLGRPGLVARLSGFGMVWKVQRIAPVRTS